MVNLILVLSPLNLKILLNLSSFSCVALGGYERPTLFVGIPLNVNMAPFYFSVHSC